MKLTAIWPIEASFRNTYPISSSKCFDGMKLLITRSRIFYVQKRSSCLRIGRWLTWAKCCLAVWFFNVQTLPFWQSWSAFNFTNGVPAKWSSWMMPHSKKSTWICRGSLPVRRSQHTLNFSCRTLIKFIQWTTFLLLLPSKTGNLPLQWAIKRFSWNFWSNVVALGVLP